MADEMEAPTDSELESALMDSEIPQLQRGKTQRFEDVRKQRIKRLRKEWCKYFLQQFAGVVISATMYCLCGYFGQPGIDKGNTYTQNHVKFNKLYFWCAIWGYSFNSFVWCIRQNMGLRTRIKFVDFFIILTFFSIRILALGSYLYFVFPYLCECVKLAYTRGEWNDWKSESEPYFTSDSYFNAFVCWFICFLLNFCIYLLSFLFGFYSVIGIMMCFNPRTRVQVNQFLKIFFLILGTQFFNWLFGVKYRHGYEQFTKAQDFGVMTDEEQQAEAYLNTKLMLEREKKTFAKLNFNEAFDCPICFETFTDQDDIIQFDCSEKHIYHLDCARQLLTASKRSGEPPTCAMCRAVVNLDQYE